MKSLVFRNTDIVDSMLQMMEKYTDQLEELVDQRTRQLEIENRRASLQDVTQVSMQGF